MRGIRATIARTMIRLAALAFVSLSFVGCGAGADPTLVETVEQTYPLDSTASISVTNRDGAIRIYGGGDELKMQAIKKAYTAERLNKIKINVVARPNTVSITTDYPPQTTWGFSDRSGTVDYTIIIPETAQLVRVELANGEVAVEGLRGGGVHERLGSGLLFGR